MKKSFKRVTAMLMSVFILLALLASCSDEKTPQSTDTDPQTETEAVTAASTEESAAEIVDAEQVAEPTFIDADFGGQTFTILCNSEIQDLFDDHYIDNDELNGEPINDAVIERNRAVEEKYNVEIVTRDTGIAEAKTSAKAGTVDFELIYDTGALFAADMIVEGLLYDFLQIPYLDLAKEYWAPSLQEDLIFADKMLITTCDISMNRLGHTMAIVFNKRLLNEFGLEEPYDLVDSGEWTVDKYIELVVQCSSDVNGDKLWTVDDVYGDGSGSPVGIAIQAGGIYDNLTVKNVDGTYTVNVYTQKVVDIYNKYTNMSVPEGTFCDIVRDEWIADRDISQYEDKYEAARVFNFGEGHSTFNSYALAYLGELEQMEDQYGILPNPKLDAEQEEYYHNIDPMISMFAVVKQSDKEFVGTVMEYMAYESNQRVLPAFYAQTLREDADERDEAMIDIICNSYCFDIWYLYTDAAVGVETLMSPTMFLSKIIDGNTFKIQKYTEDCQATIDAAYDFVYNLDVNN